MRTQTGNDPLAALKGALLLHRPEHSEKRIRSGPMLPPLRAETPDKIERFEIIYAEPLFKLFR
jgi:hypothetical protein